MDTYIVQPKFGDRVEILAARVVEPHEEEGGGLLFIDDDETVVARFAAEDVRSWWPKS